MPLNISSLDLKYASVGAIRQVQPVERREDKQAIAADAGKDRNSPQSGFLRRQLLTETQALAQLAPVKPTLLPSDELAIFGDRQNHAPSQLAYEGGTLTTITAGEATAEDGSEVAVEIITPQNISAISKPTEPARILPLVIRSQSIAAGIYARNADIVFNVGPASLLAA